MLLLRQIPQSPRKAVLFDFDGTLSLIRKGWQEVMVTFMVEELRSTHTPESTEEIESLVRDYVALLTGKQTVYQMIRLAEEVERRGGKPLDPIEYKHRYHDRLWKTVGARCGRLRRGEADPDEWLLPGSRRMLEAFEDLGLQLYLASGTDLQYVLEEARLLSIDHFFRDRIYGALDEYRRFSKRMVIRHILEDHGLGGSELIAFGDGYVEIEETRRVSGVAVGVASNEETGVGYDESKRERLQAAGADLLIPNFLEWTEILATLGIPARAE